VDARDELIAQWWRGLDADDRNVARQVAEDSGSMPSALTRSLTRAGVVVAADPPADDDVESGFAMPRDVAVFVAAH
jgi:hypothetical protein